MYTDVVAKTLYPFSFLVNTCTKVQFHQNVLRGPKLRNRANKVTPSWIQMPDQPNSFVLVPWPWTPPPPQPRTCFSNVCSGICLNKENNQDSLAPSIWGRTTQKAHLIKWPLLPKVRLPTHVHTFNDKSSCGQTKTLLTNHPSWKVKQLWVIKPKHKSKSNHSIKSSLAEIISFLNTKWLISKRMYEDNSTQGYSISILSLWFFQPN